MLDGGSLYWVIKGFVLVRQRVLDLRADLKDDGTACCGIVLDAELVVTRPHPRRAFQGWRYLDAADVPRDAKGFADERRRDTARHARGVARASAYRLVEAGGIGTLSISRVLPR